MRTDLEHAAELMEIWRLCRKSRCKRARSCCGDTRACCEMLVDWSEALSLKDKRVSFEEAMQRLRDRHQPRHARPIAGHPRFCGSTAFEDVDGRDKPGHDGLVVVEKH